MKALLSAIALVALVSCTHSLTKVADQPQQSSENCGDFLAEKSVSHPDLKLKSCVRDEKNQQAVVYVASYEVAGSKAKEVESLLVSKTELGNLKFICCGWEPTSGKRGHFRDSANRLHSVTMYSGETLEKDWNKIPTFTVSVERWMTNP